jgi:hypothetical protein
VLWLGNPASVLAVAFMDGAKATAHAWCRGRVAIARGQKAERVRPGRITNTVSLAAVITSLLGGYLAAPVSVMCSTVAVLLVLVARTVTRSWATTWLMSLALRFLRIFVELLTT